MTTYTLKDWMLGLVVVVAVGVPAIWLVTALMPILLPAGFPTPVAGIMAVVAPLFILWSRRRQSRR